jgi:hypothetical protein
MRNMFETRIDISKLKSEGGDVIKELNEFLKEKIKGEIGTGADEIVIKSEEKAVSRAHVRLLLRKFLHRKELKDYYRVIGGKENTLAVVEKKVEEQEE